MTADKPKVVSLTGEPIHHITGTSVDRVVRALEKALVQAKRGDIIGIGLVKIRPQGVIGTTWECSDRTVWPLLLAGCSVLSHDLIASSTVVNLAEGE